MTNLNVNDVHYQSSYRTLDHNRRSTMIVATGGDLNFMMGYMNSQKNQDMEIESPFNRRNQASFRSLSDLPRPINKSHRKSQQFDTSSEKSLCRQSSESLDSYSSTLQGPSCWANSFEKMLEDVQGIHVFAEFLKKEISVENIYFWAACERYRQMNDHDRIEEAIKIYEKYLGTNATDPVNVDSKARTVTKERVNLAEKELFETAQKQIFNLMKFDSYQRFIKSDLFKIYIDAEQKRFKLPYPSEQLDPLLRITNHSGSNVKIKKSYSNAEDRRKTSLLPWHRKTRSQSKDRLKESKHEIKEKFFTSPKNSNSDLQGSKNSLIFNFEAMLAKNCDTNDGNSFLCRVVLPDGANSISHVKDESIRDFVNRILEKRGICFQDFEVFYFSSSKSLDLSVSALTLARKEIRVEQRVLFKLDLPNKKVISVKSKANKLLFEVLKPILNKYNFKMEEIVAFSKDHKSEPINTSLPVTTVEGQRLLILYKNCEDLEYKTSKSDKFSTLDEITNKVFNEVLQGKYDSNLESMNKRSEKSSIKSEDFNSEASSTRRRQFLPAFPLRPQRTMRHASGKETSSNESTEADTKKPLIAKLKAGVKLQVPKTQQSEELLEEIKKAQLMRFEDQRGTEINTEIPDFLKDKENLRKAQFESPYGLDSEASRPQPAPRLSLSHMNTSVSSVLNRVQTYESNLRSNIFPDQINLSPTLIKNQKTQDDEEYNISDLGNTTMVFQHTDVNRNESKERPSDISAPPLPPKPKARQGSNPSSPQKLDKPQFPIFPSGTFI